LSEGFLVNLFLTSVMLPNLGVYDLVSNVTEC